jgi:hypothetical protein
MDSDRKPFSSEEYGQVDRAREKVMKMPPFRAVLNLVPASGQQASWMIRNFIVEHSSERHRERSKRRRPSS